MTKNVIIHGDSRNYIPRIKTPINAVVTDPPFGMDFVSNFAKTAEGKQYTNALQGDATLQIAIDLFHSVMGPIVEKMADDCEIYVFTAWHVLDFWMDAVRNLAFLNPEGHLENHYVRNEAGIWVPYPLGPDPRNNIELKMMLVWEKGWPGLGDLDGNWGCGHEIILYAKKGRRLLPHRRSGVLHYDKPVPSKQIHPTEKPVSLLEELIKISTDPGDLVVDPFSGSGSTSRAAKNLGRNSLAFEIDERYIARSRARLEELSLFDNPEQT